MRLGLIGLGRIGSVHAQTLAGLDAVTGLVVADVAPGVAASVAERLGATAVDSPEEVLRAGVDGVVVAAATSAHPELILAGVEAGLPVFCEKPVAAAITDGATIAARVTASGVPVQIGYQRRFDLG